MRNIKGQITSHLVIKNSLHVLGLDDLVNMVEGYRQRVYNEDMLAIDKAGGKMIHDLNPYRSGRGSLKATNFN